jgi:hypothetical protein
VNTSLLKSIKKAVTIWVALIGCILVTHHKKSSRNLILDMLFDKLSWLFRHTWQLNLKKQQLDCFIGSAKDLESL